MVALSFLKVKNNHFLYSHEGKYAERSMGIRRKAIYNYSMPLGLDG